MGLPAGRIWAQWRERDRLDAPFRIVSINSDGSDFRVEYSPPPEWEFFRPIVAKTKTGTNVFAIACPRGSKPDLWGMFGAQPVLNGKIFQRPNDIIAWGHANVSAGGTRLTWAAWRNTEKDFRTYTSDWNLKNIVAVGPLGFVEPEWTNGGRIIGVQKQPDGSAYPMIRDVRGKASNEWPLRDKYHAYDPDVVPGEWVVWLRLDQNGLMIAPWNRPDLQRFLVPPSAATISNPRVVSPDTLITSRKLDALNYGLVAVEIPTGKITPLTKVEQGNFEQPFLVPNP